MYLGYNDPFVEHLYRDIGGLIEGDTSLTASIEARLTELSITNCPAVAAYHRRTRAGLGVPDTAFRGTAPYFFPDAPVARTFRTSGTSGPDRGSAAYSARGLELMKDSILAHARRSMLGDLATPAILRFVPGAQAAPEMVMAYGMELIADRFGHPELSAGVVGPRGIDLSLLKKRLEAAISDDIPVVLIGGSFAFVNICDALEAEHSFYHLPSGSRWIDAGGFKGRSRVVAVAELRKSVEHIFGIPPTRHINLFGMTELASQLYDACDLSVGPLGERPKGRAPFVEPRVRNPWTLELIEEGQGLLEVVDLCILDRPCTVLTGDRGIARPEGVAIAGRIERNQSRGCSLSLDDLTARGGTDGR